MKIRVLNVFLVFVLLICSSGCSNQSLYKDYDITKSEIFDNIKENREKEFDLQINNEASYDELITKEEDIHFIAQNAMSLLLYSTGCYLKEVEDSIGIECLRMTEEGSLYSVHKIKQGGLVYMFYSWDPFGRMSLEHSEMSYVFYVLKDLSYADFSNIKEGSTLEDVINIDPAAAIYKNLYESNTEKFDKSGIESLHYLNNGILCISYDCEDGMVQVSEIDYYEEYDFNLVTYSWVLLQDQHILPKDRITTEKED